jgi:L-iditol 2-dehydrogenase
VAVELVRPGGLVLLHGGCPVGSVVELPTERIHYSEITLRGSFHHTPRVFAQALAMLAAGDVNVAEFLGPPIGLDEVGPALTSSPGVKHPVRM